MNPFVTTSIAKRYAEARPYHHDIVVDLVRKRLQLSGRVASALDVACGTGMSTRAMADIADKTVGTDVSPSMLVEAPGEPRLMYAAASAECLPFRPDSFELVTVSSALHWFDRCRFLAEVGAVTRPQGWLVIYENGFMGTMKENAAFADWRNDTYHTRYPAPPRHREPLTEDQARQAGFDFVSTEEYRNWVRFDPEALAKYLTTQSNVIAAVDEGRQTLAEVFEWLVGQVCPFFVAQSGTFEFGDGSGISGSTETLFRRAASTGGAAQSTIRPTRRRSGKLQREPSRPRSKTRNSSIIDFRDGFS